jgi:hypothetical protein
MDGNWWGYRDTLADRGIVFSGNSISDFKGNVSGGERRAFAAAKEGPAQVGTRERLAEAVMTVGFLERRTSDGWGRLW